MDFNITGIKDTILVGCQYVGEYTITGYQYAVEKGVTGYQYAAEKGMIGYQYATENGSVLVEHTVTVLKQGLEFVRRDVRAAAVCFALLNTIFFEIALAIARFASLETDNVWKNLYNLTIFTSSIAGMNAALAIGLQTQLTAEQIALVSVASCTSYFFFRVWLASLKG